MLTTIKCFLYDNIRLNTFLKEIFNYLSIHECPGVSLKKGYAQGFHISIRIEEENEPFIDFIKEQYILYTAPGAVDYEKAERLIKAVARMEENGEVMLPLLQDGSLLISGDLNFSPRKKVYSIQTQAAIEKIQTEFLTGIYAYWSNIDENQQNYIMAYLFMLLGSYSPDGLKSGYLAMRSNYEYFVEQLKDIGHEDKRKEWKHYISFRNEQDLYFIQNGVADFFEKKCPVEKEAEKYLEKLRELLRDSYNNGGVNTQALYSAATFFERHEHSSSFHQLFYKNNEFLENYEEKNFTLYRLILGEIYSLFPELNMSNLRKQKITGLTAEAVEAYYKISWKDVYDGWLKTNRDI
ncbi:hypothetical protein [Paenibacillus sp. MMS20-IR301]|uniref:hypothetical protein n=1 Tax=Paenibacillus sp. MMS20-IR301 TaxID=2895946 RepID=UPI0028EB28CD|nr:hypothetical protein [Paenibacillus sp. MMS20-IR301]WNS43479.1 hypothetical protein LOS79_31845 [Paenibacillus sp. MMS20-IR301]